MWLGGARSSPWKRFCFQSKSHWEKGSCSIVLMQKWDPTGSLAWSWVSAEQQFRLAQSVSTLVTLAGRFRKTPLHAAFWTTLQAFNWTLWQIVAGFPFFCPWQRQDRKMHPVEIVLSESFGLCSGSHLLMFKSASNHWGAPKSLHVVPIPAKIYITSSKTVL